MTTSQFCEGLVEQFPDLAIILAEHISDNDGLLPHLFIADVYRYVIADGRSRSPIVECLENTLASEGLDVENLIAVSFVENIESRDELGRATDGVTAPKICALWKQIYKAK